MKTENKKDTIYFVLALIILWFLAYGCFAFVLAEFNPFNWEQASRSSYVFTVVSIFVLSIPVSQLIKLQSK